MTDAVGDRSASAPGDGPATTDGGVHFEETIALSDSGPARTISRLAGGVALLSIVGTIVLVPLAVLVFFGAVAFLSGRPVVDVVTTVASGLPPFVLLFLGVFGLVAAGGVLATAGTVVRSGGLAYRDEVHTRVTDRGVEVDRDGGLLTQSSGVSIPFETISTVEYVDPGGEPKVNPGDVRAEKFIGGRSGDWVRIGRRDGPAVYVGSDRPRELADVIAGLAPGVDGAEPFS